MEARGFLQGRSRESSIRRDAQGRWFHEGAPVENAQIARAFDRWVGRTENGRYCLRNEIDWVYITLEGPPLFVRAIRIEPAGKILLFLSNETQEELDPATLRQGGDGALYCDVMEGCMTARFDRHAMYDLHELIGEDEQGVYLRLGENLVRPPLADDPLRLLSVNR